MIHSSNFQLFFREIQTLSIINIINQSLLALDWVLRFLCCHYCPRTWFWWEHLTWVWRNTVRK